MSIDINWQILTEEPDGIKVAEKIRDFVHAKFQTAQLPRFVKGVKVHTFDPGSIAPQIEIMDICDPMPDFYEEIDSEDDYYEEEEKEDGDGFVRPRDSYQEDLRNRPRIDRDVRTNEPSQSSQRPPFVDTRLPGLRSIQIPGEIGSPFLGVSTPGIPGGTSNRSYFHSHLATGLSAAQTPLAAVAGAHLPNGWPDYSYLPPSMKRHRQTASGDCVSPPRSLDSNPQPSLREKGSLSTLATSAGTTRPQTHDGIIEDLVEEEPTSSPRRFREPRTEDVQIVFRVRYAGDVKLSLTAEILLDYPMPSFVGIPVKLNITGLSLDGVAVLAYIRKRAHFCFLSPEDAHGAIVAESADDAYMGGTRTGGILHEIKVESEIGQRESGKTVLKNVGKVEKFVLEQVRRIFEDEFVYPSFWTFLV